MSLSRVPDRNRREFFRAAARYCLLGALGLVSSLVRAKGRLSGQRCINRGLCNGCVVFASCGLPQALSAKLAKPGGDYERLRKKY